MNIEVLVDLIAVSREVAAVLPAQVRPSVAERGADVFDRK